MPDSTSSRTVTFRIANRYADELRAIAARRGVTVSQIVAAAVLHELRRDDGHPSKDNM